MKKFLRIGGIIFAAGLIIFFIGFAAARFDIAKISTKQKFVQKSYVCDNAVNSITVDDKDIPVSIGISQDDKIHITYYENDKEHYQISNDGGLVVKKVMNMKWYDYVFNINFQEVVLTVQIPQNYEGKIKLSTDNGKITATGITVDNFNASTSNGSIELRSVKSANDIKLYTSNGSITLNDVSAVGDINASSSNSGIQFRNVNGNTTEMKTSNGDISIQYVSVKSGVTAQTSNGSLRLEKVDTENLLNLQTSNGSISGSVLGKIADFSITSKTSNGSNNLPENMASGSKKLSAINSNGRIDIDFVQ